MVTEENAFSFHLEKEKLVLPAPRADGGLMRNCVVIYQVRVTTVFDHETLKYKVAFQAILARQKRIERGLYIEN